MPRLKIWIIHILKYESALKHRQNGEAYPKYGGKISNVVCDAGAHRHRRKHPLSVSAVNKQQCFRTLLYPILPTEETISGRMAYPGKNPLSRVCLFNCSKSGMSGKWTQKGYRVDETIGIGDQIVPLVQEEVELLMRIGTDKQLVEMSSGIIENDRVRILSGPLMGMEGNIRRIDRHKRIAYLEIEMFGRTVEMKVGLEIIRKE